MIKVGNKSYKKIKHIGKGVNSEVLLVENVDNKQLMALKMISFNSTTEQQSVLNEIQILKSTDHPNIVKYYEYQLDLQRFTILMEYADNGDLAKQIQQAKKKKQHLEENIILEWFVQIAMAISYLHENLILHRDVKLQNIFLDKKGVIKLGDFGIAKLLDKNNQLAQTTLGTPYYISPEICLGKKYNFKSDIWMLGCVLHEICSYEKPFSGENLHVFFDIQYTLQDIINQIVNVQHRKIPDFYSGQLKKIIDELLQKDPNLRPGIKEILSHQLIKEKVKTLKQQYSINNQVKKNNEQTNTQKTLTRNNHQISKLFDDYSNSDKMSRSRSKTPLQKRQEDLYDRILDSPLSYSRSSQRQKSAKIQDTSSSIMSNTLSLKLQDSNENSQDVNSDMSTQKIYENFQENQDSNKDIKSQYFLPNFKNRNSENNNEKSLLVHENNNIISKQNQLTKQVSFENDFQSNNSNNTSNNQISFEKSSNQVTQVTTDQDKNKTNKREKVRLFLMDEIGKNKFEQILQQIQLTNAYNDQQILNLLGQENKSCLKLLKYILKLK